MTYADDAHPAFHEARRLRRGVLSMPAATRSTAMLDLTNDTDGRLASGLIMLYHDEPNPMDAMLMAFLAGLLIGRDGG